MAANMLKTRKHTVSQLQLKSDQTLHQSADSLLEGDFTISSFRQFQTSIVHALRLISQFDGVICDLRPLLVSLKCHRGWTPVEQVMRLTYWCSCFWWGRSDQHCDTTSSDCRRTTDRETSTSWNHTGPSQTRYTLSWRRSPAYTRLM